MRADLHHGKYYIQFDGAAIYYRNSKNEILRRHKELLNKEIISQQKFDKKQPTVRSNIRSKRKDIFFFGRDTL